MIDPELALALVPVLRDVAATTPIAVEVAEPRDDLGGDGRSAIVWGPTIAGMGVWFVEGLSSAERVASVADQVQEVVIKELWHAGLPVAWPPCPLHPDTHPLQATVVASRAVWWCPKSSESIEEVGALGRR